MPKAKPQDPKAGPAAGAAGVKDGKGKEKEKGKEKGKEPVKEVVKGKKGKVVEEPPKVEEKVFCASSVFPFPFFFLLFPSLLSFSFFLALPLSHFPTFPLPSFPFFPLSSLSLSLYLLINVRNFKHGQERHQSLIWYVEHILQFNF